MVDGFFVSNYVGKTPFVAVNFIMPFLLVLGCVGFMFGTGGGALIAKTLGEGDRGKANRIFSMLVWVSALCGVGLAILGQLLLVPVAALLGAEGEMLADSVTYGRIILLAIPAYVLQYEFQCLFATAEKPKLGLAVTVAAGMTNVVLDALFVVGLSWGLEGAATATAVSQCVGGLAAAALLQPPQSEPAPPDPGGGGLAGAAQGLYQRLLRVFVQHLHVCGGDALQLPAPALRR